MTSQYQVSNQCDNDRNNLVESIDRHLPFLTKSFMCIQNRFHSFKKFDKVLGYLCNQDKLGTTVEL